MSNEQGSKQAKTEKESKNNASFSRGAPSSFLSSSFRQPRSPESPLFPPASAPENSPLDAWSTGTAIGRAQKGEMRSQSTNRREQKKKK